MIRTRHLVCTLAAALLAASAARAQSAADSAFDALVARHVAARAEASPEWATRVGLHERDSLLTDRSAAARRRDSLRFAAERNRLRQLDTTALDARRRVDWRLLDASLAGMLQEAGDRDWQRRPGGYVPFTAVYDLAVGAEPDAPTRMRALVRRLEGWPAAMAIGRAQVVPARTPPLWVELDVRAARGIARYLREELPAIVRRDAGDPATVARFERACGRALEALEAYAAWMDDTLRPAARGDWVYGRAAYDRRLAEAKLLDTSADSLVAFGHRELADAERELEALARRIDPTRSWRELADSAKTIHPPADSVFAAYSAEAARARAFIVERGLFTLPPGEELEMVLTPPHLRATYAYGGYSSPAPFESRPVGRFFVTPVEEGWTREQVESKLRGHNRGWITVVAVHEGYPGHHLQYARAATQPSVVRKLYGSEVFGEGWGLYSEELMWEAGFFPSPLARLTQLRMRLWRAARAVVDPSMHTGAMTYEDAVNFLVERVGLERADAEAEINRYTTWPTQAPSYALGFRALLALRAERQAAEGTAFDLRRFHDRLLGEGSLPPVLMRAAMQD